MSTVRDAGLALWFLHNPTAANLLMAVLALSGVVAIFTMPQEVFPKAVLDTIQIRVEYRGATAAEVESQVVQPMEQSIDTLLDIRTVVSEVTAGGASIFVMLQSGADARRTLDEIRSALDGLSALPADLEPPTIVQVRDDGEEMEVGFYGFESQGELHAFAEQVRDRFLALPAIGQVELDGVPEPEITVWVSPEQARLLGLSLHDIAARINQASFELSGGAIRSVIGEYGLAFGLDRRHAHQFNDIALVESDRGAPLTLGQIARVQNGFRPHGKRYRINGASGFNMALYGAGTATPQEVSDSVRALLEEIEASMPQGGAAIFDDDAKSYADRVGILADSALIGLALVLVLLFLVLEARVAFWVAVGLPVAMLGGVALFALTPFTINFISIYAFIIVIGVVVDDAMVIGEDIYAGMQAGHSPQASAANTVSRFSGVIALAIITNIIAFTPIFFMPGELGLFLLGIPVVTTCVFIVSLVEALWILPAHLAYGRQRKSGHAATPRRVQVWFEAWRDTRFVPWAQACLGRRGMVICVGCFVTAAVFSWVISGRVPIALQPAFESQQIHAYFALHPGASERQVRDMGMRIETLGHEVLKELGEVEDSEGVRVELGAPVSHQGRVSFTLVDTGQRDFSGGQFATRWQDLIGQPAELTQLSVDYLQGPGDGRDLTIELAHPDGRVSRAAAEALVRRLREIVGVGQISYSGNAFRSEVRFKLTPAGRALGFDEAEISSRLRAQLDGLEATRLTRGNDEIRVMVRGSADLGQAVEDQALPALSALILTSSDGRQVALGDIATVHWERGAVQLRRIDGQRIERVEASIDRRIVAAEQVEDLITEDLLPALTRQYPGLLTWDKAIDTDEDAETVTGLLLATVAVLVAIFVLIGGYARSLRHSAMILLTIPLSAAGALLGHFLLGIELSAASFLGVLALGGLVINACLLLHLRYQEGLRAGQVAEAAMLVAVRDRFRPIVLSSVTTLVGLAPLIFSTSNHAAAMRPVAVSIGFGMLFSIPVILLLLPCILVALEPRRHPTPNEGDTAEIAQGVSS